VKTISVVAGLRETIRVGGAPIRTGSPKSSRTAATSRLDFSHAVSASAKRRQNGKDRARKNKKRTLLPEECPQRARAKTTPDRHQDLPRGSVKVARTRVVSWLRAAGLTFPTAPAVSGVTSLRYCPLQWRGRTGFTPVSVAPVRDQLLGEAIYVEAPAQAPGSSRLRSRA